MALDKKIEQWWISLGFDGKYEMLLKYSHVIDMGVLKESNIFNITPHNITNDQITALYRTTNKTDLSDDISHLIWIYNRLINIHHENRNADYMIKFKEIISTLHKL